MSNLPFGFQQPDDDDPGPTGGSGDPSGSEPDPNEVPPDPFSAMLSGLSGLGGLGGPQGPGGMPDLGAALQQLGRMLQWQGGPVNFDLAHDVARQTAAAGGDPSVGSSEQREVAEALRLGELWLDEVTALPAAASRQQAWSRAEWLEATLPAWRELIEPIAERVVAAIGASMSNQLPAEMGPLAGQLGGMLRQVGGAMFGAQVGQALGSLATEVTSSTDAGLPLAPAGTAALVPSGVARFGEGLGLPVTDVRLYLALRESAHQRLFAHAPWLRARIIQAVDSYAGGISIDTARLEQAMGGVDPSDPDSVRQALTHGLFEPENTPQQKAALARLETLLALIEGWVDEVVHAAAVSHLPTAEALRETLRRRRASGGPAEETFATLVGLELRPRRLREAARLWQALSAARGVIGRDALWGHPDLLPGSEDLDDPDGYPQRASAAELVEVDLSALEEPRPDSPDPDQPDTHTSHPDSPRPDSPDDGPARD